MTYDFIKTNKVDFIAFVVNRLNKTYKNKECNLIDTVNNGFDITFPFILQNTQVSANIISNFVNIRIDYENDQTYYHSKNQFLDDKQYNHNKKYNEVDPYGPFTLKFTLTISNIHESAYVIDQYGNGYYDRRNIINCFSNWDFFNDLMKNGNKIMSQIIEEYNQLYSWKDVI